MSRFARYIRPVEIINISNGKCRMSSKQPNSFERTVTMSSHTSAGLFSAFDVALCGGACTVLPHPAKVFG